MTPDRSDRTTCRSVPGRVTSPCGATKSVVRRGDLAGAAHDQRRLDDDALRCRGVAVEARHEQVGGEPADATDVLPDHGQGGRHRSASGKSSNPTSATEWPSPLLAQGPSAPWVRSLRPAKMAVGGLADRAGASRQPRRRAGPRRPATEQLLIGMHAARPEGFDEAVAPARVRCRSRRGR